MRADDDQIARFREELTRGTFWRNARDRARRRKSPWNLLLPVLALPLWAVFIAAFLGLAWNAHHVLHPDTDLTWRAFLDGDAQVTIPLIVLPALFGSLAPAFVVTNVLAWLIPPVRRASERESRGISIDGYRASQRALIRIGAIAAAIAAVLVLLGAALYDGSPG